MDLRVGTTSMGSTTVVALDGTADLSAAPLLHATLRDATQRARGRLLAIDLDGVALLDDVALGLLVGAAARQRESGGALALVCTAPRVLDRLAITQLDRILTIRPTIADAHDDFARWTPSGSSATN